MLGRYIPLLVAVVIAAIIAGAMVVGSLILGPKKPTRFKETTYECGMTPVGSARDRFPIRFYLVAMLFIIFDVETVFLYPWAVTFELGSRAERMFLLTEMGIFVGILLIAYFYVVGTGSLEWGTEDDASSKALGKAKAARPPIRFGNENSGPVSLPSGARKAA
ncbi:MAG: NAD(P)H-quinone oxidoreductase subunit 3 [Chthonomonadales bacterium]|nr:NAD(P)H-quinone oxidoreductase subunit 3 [Chthonomonadales bacterium]